MLAVVRDIEPRRILMPDQLSKQELEALRNITTPTIANAIEVFNIQPRNVGFMTPDIRCILPELGVMVGYAVTCAIRAEQPSAPGREVSRPEWWDYIATIPEPRVVVVQDLDRQPIGSMWGEVNGSIHKALGCIGTVTDGGVRDLDEVRAMGFHCFASCVLVSHAYIHLVDFGTPVKIGGMVVKPGDIIHGDQHGVATIPMSIAAQIPEAVAKVESRERPLIEACRAPDFTVAKLKQVWQQVRGYA
jgi:4-hydroxy-4-methyl-2-oxoglutarate aldolase